jgi:Zn-dependent protease with chaperone function
VVTAAGAAALFACGGFVPVLRRWLADEIRLGDPAAIVATLGGVWPKTEADQAHADLGPVLGRREAAAFLEELDALARALGTAPPARPRLTFLPCCGVVASGRRTRTLVVGLPLFQVLTRGELRAVVAHELAHLARGDAGRLAGAVRLVERLEEGLDAGAPVGAWRGGPLRAWARWSYRRGAGWVAPLARAQEERADRLAAALVGGDVAASALVRVALVQPIFREVLTHLDAERPVGGNLYATFAALWRRLPEDVLTAMRHALLADRRDASPTHPRLIDRLAIVQTYASRPSADADAPAAALLADLEALQAALHRRLFADERPQPSVFHRAGS